MKKKVDKKLFIENKKQIRKDIISSATAFKKLCGKYVMYVFNNNEYIEVNYRKISFSHLTGVKTDLNAYDFYQKAIRRELSYNQFGFDSNSHPFDLAKKKTSRLNEINKFVKEKLTILKDVETESISFKFGLTDTDLTLCFSENLEKDTKEKIDDYFIPSSFRVGDDTIKRSEEQFDVTHIFIKKSKNEMYQILSYGDIDTIDQLSNDIKDKIDIDYFKRKEEEV